jgi:serine/threonine protein kinase/Tol biopolymer transport system component
LTWPADRRRVEDICDAALQRHETDRLSFVAEACGVDDALRKEVEALLSHSAHADQFLVAPIGAVAAEILADDSTSIVGRRFGVYEILSYIGSGGMGEVYRARDTRLRRDVAIKALPHMFIDYGDRLARLHSEATILASLNHSNIGAIYGLEDINGVTSLVMEFVDGEDLDRRISRGALPLGEALSIARQIAVALEAAHEKGIVHRDLKPSNIKVREDGMVKVLDFGLAKVFETESPSSGVVSPPSLPKSSASTQAGLIVGTAGYMSPEQAQGKRVDRRTDIWAFGCVLFEMLSGRRAFAGDASSDVFSSVLESDVDWTQLPANLPPTIVACIRRCLARDLRQRLRDAGDVALALEGAFDGATAFTNSKTSAAPLVSAWLRVGLPTSLLLVAIVVGWRLLPTVQVVPARSPVRFKIPLTAPVTDQLSVAVSRDGRRIAFSQTPGGLFIRDIDQDEVRQLKDTDGAIDPFFSPDGRWLAFFADGQLKKILLDGGTISALCSAPEARGGSWAPGGTIVWGRAVGGLMQVSSEGGSPTALTKPDAANGEVADRFPFVLPDGSAVIFSAGPAITAPDFSDWSHVVAQTLPAGERRVLTERGSSPQVANGFLTYMVGYGLYTQPFNAAHLEVMGPRAAVPYMSFRRVPSGGGQYALSDNGTLVFARGERLPVQLVWADRHGKTVPLPLAPGSYAIPRISPDGSRLAMTMWEPESDIWTYDIAHGSLTRVTTDGNSFWPKWTPDGSSVVFGRIRAGQGDIVLSVLDNPVRVEELVYDAIGAYDWTPDGRTMVYGRNGDLFVFRRSDIHAISPLWQSPAVEAGATFSPDGRWLAYQSDESGRREIYVRPFDRPGESRRVSKEGGSAARWARDGHELFFSRGREIWAVEVRDKLTLTLGEPHKLFEGPYELPNASADQSGFDVAPDGRFLLSVLSGSPPPVHAIQVVLDWADELTRPRPMRLQVAQ